MISVLANAVMTRVVLVDHVGVGEHEILPESEECSGVAVFPERAPRWRGWLFSVFCGVIAENCNAASR